MLIKVFPSVVYTSGTIAAGNLLADLTTANAFIAPVGIDFAEYRDGRCWVEVKNVSGGYRMEAYISQVGSSGETFTDIISGATLNGNMETGDPPTGWSATRGTPSRSTDCHSGTYALLFTRSAVGTDGYFLRGASGIQYALYYHEIYAKVGTATSVSLEITAIDYGNSQVLQSTNNNTYTKLSGYATPNIVSSFPLIIVRINGSNGQTGYFDDALLQKVLTPPSTGALLTSTPGGSRGLKYLDASFNANSACTLKIIQAKRIR